MLRSNQAQDFGAGRKLVIVSCRCYSMASSPRNDRMQLKAEVWAKSARAAKEEVERSERLRLIR